MRHFPLYPLLDYRSYVPIHPPDPPVSRSSGVVTAVALTASWRTGSLSVDILHKGGAALLRGFFLIQTLRLFASYSPALPGPDRE